jgi:hypothetical protein
MAAPAAAAATLMCPTKPEAAWLVGMFASVAMRACFRNVSKTSAGNQCQVQHLIMQEKAPNLVAGWLQP